MPNTTTNETVVATVETEAPTEENTVASQTRVRARTIEELKTVNPASMSKAEATKYIKYLHSEIDKLNMQMQQYKENADSAYRKVQHFEQKANLVAQIYENQHNFIVSNLRNLMHNIDNSSAITRINISKISEGGYSNAD